MQLTQRRIEQITVEAGRRDRLVFDDEQRGLAVRITKSGGRSYLCQYTLNKLKWRVPLGSCASVKLADARKAAAAVMGEVAKGNNPAADRKREAAEAIAQRNADKLTLRTLIEEWKRLRLVECRPSYAVEAVRALHFAFADYLDQPAEKLDRAAIVRTLDNMESRASAHCTGVYGRACFAWAAQRESLPSNPFNGLPLPGKSPARDHVLSDSELGEIWRTLPAVGEPYASIVRLLMLTGQRRSEVAGMTKDEISGDMSVWTIPGTRTKNGKPHIVPLSESARSIIRDLPRLDDKNPLVFPAAHGSTFAAWSRVKLALDAAVKIEPWRLHDLRRTVATGLQRLGVRLEVTEAVLNHVSGSRSGIVGVYQRHTWADEKRAAVIEGRKPAGNVTNFRKVG